VEVNGKLTDEPQLVRPETISAKFRVNLQINKSPYGDGWLMKVKYEADDEVEQLMDKAAYDPYCEGLSH